MQYQISKKSYVFQIRIYIIFISIITVLVFQFIEVDDKFSLLLGILGMILTITTFIEPLINPLVKIFFKEILIIKRLDIYKNVIEHILTAERIVMFKTPTTTWGVYSEGLRIFEDTIDAIKKVTSRGVEVRIIADIWDWERAKFALALKNAGANIKYNETVHDYYLIKDEKLLLTMGTETRHHQIEMLDRNVRRLSETATLSLKESHIKLAILKFQEEWDRIKPKKFNKIIEQYSKVKCPYCKNSARIKFENESIKLNKWE